MNATIITIGDEILVGQTIDTNSAWLGKRLNEEGIAVKEIVSISDSELAILETVDRSIPHSDLVIITGGLGPTNDDITKKTLAKYFNSKLVRNAKIEMKIEAFFHSFGKSVLEVNKQQADLPDNCILFENEIGTASGMLWEKNQTYILSLPGVPYEMKHLTNTGLIPYLKRKSPKRLTILHKNILTAGIGESALADIIKEWEASLSEHAIKLAYLPNPGLVKLRLSYYGSEKAEIINPILESKVKALQQYIPEYYIGEEALSIAETIGKLLTAHGKTLGIIESCTGGNISRMITENPGSSAYYKGSVVAYSNEIKENIVGVASSLIEKHGAVSEEVAASLAKKGKELLKVDYCISTTGIAGPEGGSVEKPVGLVCTSIAGNTNFVNKSNFGSSRNRVVQRASVYILTELLKMLRNDFPS